jgi:hypothetical protein
MTDNQHKLVPTALLLLTGLIVPNVLFTGGALLGIAIESRTLAIVLYCLIALLPGPVWIRVALFAVVLAFDVISIMAGLFGFDAVAMLMNFRYALEIDVLSNRLYLVIVCTAVAVLVGNIVLMITRKEDIRRGERSILLAACLALIFFDGISHSSSSTYLWGQFKPLPAFSSSVAQSNLLRTVERADKPHVLLVMMESFGTFHDRTYRDLVFEPLLRRKLPGHAIIGGDTPFWATTTAAEMRELCGSTMDYRDVQSGADPECMPDIFRKAGYRTVAFHGFWASFFHRDTWYPRLGFERSVFLADLRKVVSDVRCGTVWQGICDNEVGDRIEMELENAAGPTFLYWLTLNSHVPVGELQTGELRCGTPAAPVENLEVCRMVELWRDVVAKVAELAEKHENLEVLLVGDHRPPLLHRTARYMFSDDTVPWLHLALKPQQLANGKSPAQSLVRPQSRPANN